MHPDSCHEALKTCSSRVGKLRACTEAQQFGEIAECRSDELERHE